MQLIHALSRLETAVDAQLRLGGEGLEDVGAALLEALRPAVRQSLMEVVEAASNEISSQLTGQRVEIRLRDGEPDLVVVDYEPTSTIKPEDESLEARITLRLPEYLKSVIEDAAEDAGDSINTWVMNALKTKAQPRGGSSMKGTIDL